MSGAKNEIATYSVRGAVRFLDQHGVEVSEMRMRTLARNHEIFNTDPNTKMGYVNDSDVQQWRISEKALRSYVEAVRKGVVRGNASGSKVYKISLNADQFSELVAWAKERNIAEPTRAFKGTKKADRSRDNGQDTAFYDDDTDDVEAEEAVA